MKATRPDHGTGGSNPTLMSENQPKGLAGPRQDFVGNIQQGGRHRVSKRIV